METCWKGIHFKAAYLCLPESLTVQNIISIQMKCDMAYSKIPILRPLLGKSKSGLKDHFWTVPKVVFNQRYTKCGK